jgi:hypothetical protein
MTSKCPIIERETSRHAEAVIGGSDLSLKKSKRAQGAIRLSPSPVGGRRRIEGGDRLTIYVYIL